MAIQAYIKIKANGSDLAGSSVDTKDHGDFCDVITFEMGSEVNRELTTGRATGRRQHKPLVVVKPLDKASPLLFQALVQNQVIEAELELWRDKPKGGGREKYYTYELTEGRVVGIEQFAPEDDSPLANRGTMERLSISFQKIVVTWQDGGITAEDNFTDSTF